MKVIGLTGNIGSGKSTVSSIISSFNIRIIDADIVAREVSKDTKVLKLLADAFGEDIIDNEGMLNRQKLGKIVFNCNEKLKELNNIMHPFMKTRIKEIINEFSRTERLCILDGAIIIEAGFDDLVDDIILITAKEENILKRVHERDGHPYEYIKNVIRNQMSVEKKKKLCRYIIENDKGLEELKLEVIKVLKALDMEA